MTRRRSGRVLLVTNDFPPRQGGIESLLYSMAVRWPTDDLVVYTSAMPGSRLVDRELPCAVLRDPASTLLPTAKVAHAVRRALVAHGCDRVVFGAAAPLALLAPGLARAGVRRMVALTHGHEVWWATLPATRRLLRRMGDSVDAMTYVSEYCRQRIAPALSVTASARMHRLSPAVDLQTFSPGLDGSPQRRALGISPDQPLVLSASRLVARKGQDVLLHAWPQVLEQHPRAVLVIAGDGPMRATLRKLAQRLDVAHSVRFMAGVRWQQMPELYAAADVFALPCRTRRWGLEPEALGIVFLEAAATGLPLVVGASGGAGETVVDGSTGHLVDPRHPGSVAERVAGLLDEPEVARAMGLRGRQWVGARFGVEPGEVLRRLLADPRD